MIRLDVAEGRLTIGYERLSEQQASALVSDREVAVSAGAGAGKTSTLAARYVSLFERLVESGHAPDIASVLVLTFTEKAAQEMRERCYAATAAVARQLRTEGPRLVAAGLPEATCLRLRARWEALRDRFAGAAISTFHGFCARILREFPAETATPPGFTILEEPDADLLLQSAAVERVDAWLADEHPQVGLLLDAFAGRGGLVEALRQLLAARGEVEPTLRAHTAGRASLTDATAGAPLRSDEVRTFLTGEWGPLADRLLNLTVGVETAFLRALAEVRDAVRTLPDDELELYERYAAALSVLCSSSGGLRKLAHPSSTGIKAMWGDRHKASRAPLEEIQAEVSAWAGRLAHLQALPNRHDRTLHDVLAALGVLYAEAAERHADALRAAGAVDFTELQLRVRAAFHADGPVAEELRKRHRFVMVDEFQDTDALQWSIVEALARPAGGENDRLFFVGDVKQAIYGFRGGDVQVFNAARRTVEHAVELSTNYRSRPELIGFFNRLFADVLGPDEASRPTWEAPFAPLAPGRRDTGGSVRIATYPGKDTDPPREAAWLADLLRDEVLAERGPYAGLSLGDVEKHPSPPVAVLLRRRTHLATYEEALRARGIPYVVVGGVGFWSRPEVVDVTNVLHGLVRRDTLSLVAALRSPFFGLTDQDLWDLADADLLRRFADVRIVERFEGIVRIRAAHALWRELLELKDRVSASELVEAILRRTRQAWVQAYTTPGGRAAANLERLLAIVDRHEQRGVGLDALVARLLERVGSDAQDAEAAVPTSTARVALLTVHASKGLEYPVVLLPDLAARPVRPSGTMLRRRVGERWELACLVPDRYGPVDRRVAPGKLGQLQAFAATVEAAESRRLFYVACTRARDHLVLLGARSEEAPEMEAATRWSELLHRHDGGAEDPPWLLRDEVPEPVEGGGERAEPPVLAPPPADLAARLAPVPGDLRVGVSPSSLALFARDPEAWYLRHVLRLPEEVVGTRGGATGGDEEEAPAAPALPQDERLVVASLRGQVLHGLLEDDLLDDVAVAHARWRATAAAEGLSEATVAAGWPELEAQAATLRTSPDVRTLLATQGYPELAVRLVRGPVTLDGRIDRLCRDPVDGEWMVVDYKSARRAGDPAALLAKHRSQLLAYSAAASRVLTHQGQPPVRRAALLLTRTGRLHRLPDWTPDDYAALEGQLAAVADHLLAGPAAATGGAAG